MARKMAVFEFDFRRSSNEPLQRFRLVHALSPGPAGSPGSGGASPYRAGAYDAKQKLLRGKLAQISQMTEAQQFSAAGSRSADVKRFLHRFRLCLTQVEWKR
jgi:hypothetical protein